MFFVVFCLGGKAFQVKEGASSLVFALFCSLCAPFGGMHSGVSQSRRPKVAIRFFGFLLTCLTGCLPFYQEEADMKPGIICRVLL